VGPFTPDTTAPTVLSTTPANGATGVAVNTSITATFSENVNASTITTPTFIVGGHSGTTTYSGTTATFTPSSNLLYNTIYTATITTGVRDSAGIAMASDYTWSFTTGAGPDTTAPTVLSTTPTHGAIGVVINTSITATFSENVDASTITTATFTVGGVSGTTTYSGTTATFTPSSNLLYNTIYTATITTGVKDLAGNAMANDYTWSFIPEPPVAPPVPTGVRVKPGDQSVTVLWNDVKEATSYNVYVASTGDINPGNVGRLPDGASHATTTSPFTLTGLANGTSYFFIVTAANSDAESTPSIEVSATPSRAIAVALAAGENHTCALIASGIVKCWGANYAGQLGSGPPSAPSSATSQPVQVSGITTAIGIAAGRYHTCANLSDGQVSCWGENKLGQLGNGGIVASSAPIPVSNILKNGMAVYAGKDHACAQLMDATLSCWGSNKEGQLGSGGLATSPLPVQVSGVKRNILFSAGYTHSCADSQSSDLVDRKIKCWGKNESGQLGNNTLTDTTGGADTAVKNFQTQVPGVVTDNAIALATGFKHSCAIVEDGSVNCWGSSEFGQLGNSVIGAGLKSNVPVLTSGITNAIAISAGESHTCAVLSDNSVQCWGANHAGQLGTGTLLDSPTPVTVPGLSARVVSAGLTHTCAILLEGNVKCWGGNGFGQLGNREFANAPLPKAVSITNVQDVFAGEHHTCALIVGGTMKCWGSNFFGQLGSGTSNSEFAPVDVPLATIAGIGTGGDHTCVRLSDTERTVQCWGRNRDGQLGIGSKGDIPQDTPIQVHGLNFVDDIAGGGDHTCTIRRVDDSTGTSTAQISCWGKNKSGQLGDGSITDAITPAFFVTLPATTTPIKVIAGDKHTCGLLSNTTMVCWGENSAGQLGEGTTSDTSQAKAVKDTLGSATLTGVTAFALGGGHTCAIITGGGLNCWGSNSFGQLAVEKFLQISIPKKVTIGNVKGIALGDHHTCGLLTNETVSCWGSNEFGELGNGKNVSVATPLTIQGLTSVRSIASGKTHTCAVTTDNGLKCWGNNLYGQLGTGDIGFHTTPVSVMAIP